MADAPWTPTAIPESISEKARRLVHLAQQVPPGHWVTYDDLAEAAGSSPRGVASALSFLPPGTPIEQWPVPWHRIRLKNGHLKERLKGEQIRPDHALNLLYLAEGGRLIGGAAAPGRHFNLAAEARAGRITLA